MANELLEDELINIADEEISQERDLVAGRYPADASLVSNQTGYGLEPQVEDVAQPQVQQGFTPQMLERPEDRQLTAEEMATLDAYRAAPQPSPIQEVQEDATQDVINTGQIDIAGKYKPKAVTGQAPDYTEIVEEPDLITQREKVAPMISDAAKVQEKLQDEAAKAEMKAVALETGAQEHKLKAVEDLHNKLQDLEDQRRSYIKEKRRTISSKAEADSSSIPKKEKNRTSLMIAGFLSGLGAGLQGRSSNFGQWLNQRLAVEAKKSAEIKKDAAQKLKSGLKGIEEEDKYLKERIKEIKIQRYKEVDAELAKNLAKAKNPTVIARLQKARGQLNKELSNSLISAVKDQIKGFEDMQKSRFKEGSATGVVPRSAGKIKDQATRDRTIRLGKNRIIVDTKKQKEMMSQFLPTVAVASEVMFNMLAIQNQVGPTELTQNLPLLGEAARRYKSYQKLLLGLIGQTRDKGGLGLYPAGVLQEWDLKAMGDIATTGIGPHSKRILTDLLKNTASVYNNTWKSMGISQGHLPPEMRFKGLTRGLMRKARRAAK